MCTSSPIQETDKGVRLIVRVIPKAKRNEAAGVRAGRLLVKVTAAPERGAANAAVVKVLSKLWGLPASTFELVSGASSRNKTWLVHGAKPSDCPLDQPNT